jgi:hypothetical protein
MRYSDRVRIASAKSDALLKPTPRLSAAAAEENLGGDVPDKDVLLEFVAKCKLECFQYLGTVLGGRLTPGRDDVIQGG